MPGLAAMPVRGARMPILQGLAWAMAGANTPGEVASGAGCGHRFQNGAAGKLHGTFPLGLLAPSRPRRWRG